MNQYVTSYRVLHSLDGKIWTYADGGKTYAGCLDRTTKVRNDFGDEIYARYIRIYPITWNEHISLRFDVIYLS